MLKIYPDSNDGDDSTISTDTYDHHPTTTILSCDLLIVDEVSMIDVLLMERLLRSLPKSSALVLVGDPYQLPSIGPGDILNTLLNSGLFPVAELTEVTRQDAQSNIITNAIRINKGQMPLLVPTGSLSDFFFSRAGPANCQEKILGMIQATLAKKPPEEQKRKIQVLCPTKCGDVGTKSLNIAIQKLLNPICDNTPKIYRKKYAYSVGDKVMQTKNNAETKIMNGTIGYVTSIDVKHQKLYITFDEDSDTCIGIPYEGDDLDNIVLAYAITIHKSQGSEYPAVIIPMLCQHGIMLQRNLLYTAITRGKGKVFIVGEHKAIETAVRTQSTAKRYTKLKEWLQIPAQDHDNGAR
jgi:exodeoxyribonuclease V alpha subunit